jgi:hypothetical protein
MCVVSISINWLFCNFCISVLSLLQPAVPFLVLPQTAAAVLSDPFQDPVYMCSSVICHYTSIAQSPTLTTNGISATPKAKCPLWSWAVAEVPAVRVCSHCMLLDGRSDSVTSRNTSRTRTWWTRILFICCAYLLLQ